MGLDSSEFDSAVNGARQKVQKFANGLEDISEAAQKLGEEVNENGEKIKDLSDDLNEATDSAEKTGDKLEDASESTKKMGDELEKSSKSAKNFGNSLSTWVVAKGVILGNLITGLTQKISNFGAQVVKSAFSYNAQMETYTTNFKVMLGSAEAAEKKIAELTKFANETPFELSDLTDATQTLLSFQVESEKASKVLKMLGDISLGNKQKLSSLALVFGQVSSAGKLTGQDLMQFINVGFNPLNYIIQRTGESMEEVRDRMSAGAVSIDEVEQALIDATSDGGQLYNGMAEGHKTLQGQWSTLKGSISDALGQLVSPLAEMASSVILPALIKQVDRVSEAIRRLMGVGDEVAESTAPIFGEGEGMVKSTRAWMDETLAVWSDGKKEEDQLVADYINTFSANSAAIKAALEERRAAMRAEGADTSEIDANIAKLAEYDTQISELLRARQNASFSAEDTAFLEQITAEKEALEQSLDAVQTAGDQSSATEKRFAAIESAIEGAGDVLVKFIESLENWKNNGGVDKFLSAISSGFKGISDTIAFVVQNWENLKKVSSAVVSLSLGFKFAGVAQKLLAALGLTLSGGPMAAVALVGSAVIAVAFDSDLQKKLAQFIDDAIQYAADELPKLGETLKDMIDSLLTAVQNKLIGLWNGTFGKLFGEMDYIKKEQPQESRGGGGRYTDVEEGLEGVNDAAGEASDGLEGATESAQKASTAVAGMSNSATLTASALIRASNRINHLNFSPAGASLAPITAHATGGIYTHETLLSKRGGGYAAVGDAGAEAVLPLTTLWQQMDAKMNQNMRNFLPDYTMLLNAMAARPAKFEIDGKTLAVATAENNQRAIDARELIYIRGKGG